MCHTYGHLIWGRHISEAPSIPERPKRFIAVPVKSSFDDECTVGVLRYACPRSGGELHQPDSIFLTELAQLIGAMLGLEAATTRTFRESLFPDELDNLRRTYDFGRFLRFVTVSLRSSIASLYVEIGDLRSPARSLLRLLDAHGIRGPVGSQRERIKDYDEGDRGFTRWLYDEGLPKPCVEDSVHTHAKWEGKNTEVFYGPHFAKLKPEGKVGAPTEIARKYTIKIVGMPLFGNGEKIGVLKVELPNRFDDGLHYGEADRVFLAQCATEIGHALTAVRQVLRGELSQASDVRAVVNVTRITAQLVRTRLVTPEEAEACWRALLEFFTQNSEQVDAEMKEILSRLPREDRDMVTSIKDWLQGDGVEWLKRLGGGAGADLILRILTGI